MPRPAQWSPGTHRPKVCSGVDFVGCFFVVLKFLCVVWNFFCNILGASDPVRIQSPLDRIFEE